MFYTIRNIRNTIRQTRFLTGACLLVLPLLLTCCADHDSGIDGSQEHSKLKLLLNVNSDNEFLSRAGEGLSDNPTGGQNGNGRRPGEYQENDIVNLCVFAFPDPDHKGISGLPAETPATERNYVPHVDYYPSYDSNDFSTQVEVDFRGLITKDYAFMVIANVGNIIATLDNQLNDNITLGSLREFLVNNTVTRGEGNLLSNRSLFTMANAANSEYKFGSGVEESPYVFSVNLERITARVDFWYQPTLEDTNNPADMPSAPLLGYKVVDKYNEANQTGWMYISHIKLMNVAQYAPYALKRLAPDASSPVAYFAQEQHMDNDEAYQYVVEPNTWAKASASVDYSLLYGNTHIDYVAAHYTDNDFFTAREAVHGYSTPQTVPNTNDGFNTGWSQDRISGESYYVLDYINENTVEKEHTTGKNTTSLLLKTKFVPKNMYYISGSELATKAANYGQTFYAMEVMTASKREKLYFDSPEAVNLYKSQNSSATFGVPVEYHNGDSYYTIWIRHDNNGNDALIGTMEYGIVRNNIYRIGVNKVLGPGSPTPVATENPEDVNLHIYVRKWNFMSVPTIYI